MNNLNKKHYYFIAGWLAVNLLQAIFTGLHSDESYYWMYSENLDWGFFDHPPMAALFIHLGHLLLPGEIGVRLFLILLSTTTLALILNELDEQEDVFFLAVFVLSFPLVHTHIAGFLAIPDIPLLFFTVLFLITYRKFLNQQKLSNSLLLGFLAAAMVYSKYHAFAVLGLIVISNLNLLRNKFFWLAVGTAVFLLIPHALWQIENEFPTFKYHLVERAKPFRLKYVFPNLINQLLMAGPLTGIIVVWKLARVKINDKFKRGLVFNIAGFYLLFFIFSFKNRIEAHWGAVLIPMLMFLTFPLISGDSKIKIWFKRLAIPVIAIMFIYRFYLAVDAIPNIGHTKITFYNREEHAREIKERANGMKVGFYNNYASLSNYIFYTGDSAVHLSTPTYRFNQYDLWNEEKYASGDTLIAVQPRQLNPPNLTRMATGQLKGFIIIDKFQSLNGLVFQLQNHSFTDHGVNFDFIFTNTTKLPIFTKHISMPGLGFMQNQTELFFELFADCFDEQQLQPGKQIIINVTVPQHAIDKSFPLTVYTRTKNNIRGEIISFNLN